MGDHTDQGSSLSSGGPSLAAKKPKFNMILGDTPFKDFIEDDVMLSETLARYCLKEDCESVTLMKSLTNASVEELRDGDQSISIIDIDVKKPVIGLRSVFPGKIFVRSFYNELVKQLEKIERGSILLGNPGTSKSWFQLYILYKVFTGASFQDVEVVVRQVEQGDMTYYFKKDMMAYNGPASKEILFRLKSNCTLYLYEPSSALKGPLYYGFFGNIIVTCSPNATRYKEFRKQCQIPIFYMPVWTLTELKLVGTYLRTKCNGFKVDYSTKAIEERYERFGGIFSSVLHESNEAYQQRIKDQESAMRSANLVDLYCVARSIEVSEANKGYNISHFLLQYDVKPPCFNEFTMRIASGHVRRNVPHIMSRKDLVVNIACLNETFSNGKIMPALFETVVYNIIEQEDTFKWEIYEACQWKPHTWGLRNKDRLKKNSEKVASMKPDTLYYPYDPMFPAIEFVFVKGSDERKQVFGIQVTYAESHRKKQSVYNQLLDRLGANEITIYIVSSPENTQGYTSGTFGKLCSGFDETVMPNLHFKVVRFCWDHAL